MNDILATRKTHEVRFRANLRTWKNQTKSERTDHRDPVF